MPSPIKAGKTSREKKLFPKIPRSSTEGYSIHRIVYDCQTVLNSEEENNLAQGIMLCALEIYIADVVQDYLNQQGRYYRKK